MKQTRTIFSTSKMKTCYCLNDINNLYFMIEKQSDKIKELELLIDKLMKKSITPSSAGFTPNCAILNKTNPPSPLLEKKQKPLPSDDNILDFHKAMEDLKLEEDITEISYDFG